MNIYTTGFQVVSTRSGDAVSVGFSGNFVVVWSSNGSSGSDSSLWSIQGQRFSVPLFADGFESGDMSGWSEVSTVFAPDEFETPGARTLRFREF